VSTVTPRVGVQERSRDRQDRLLRAAIELIGEGGPRAATHRAVSARAGLPPSTAGYYFPTADGLIESALRYYTEHRARTLTELFERALADVDDVADTGMAIARALVRDVGPGILAEFEVYLEAARNPALREAVAESMASFERVAAARLEALGVTSPHLAAKAFVAVANGFALNRLASPVPYDEDIEIVNLTLVGLYLAFGGPVSGLPEVARLTTRSSDTGGRSRKPRVKAPKVPEHGNE
jgi:DNA-binding transcriptional regulator YbjK